MSRSIDIIDKLTSMVQRLQEENNALTAERAHYINASLQASGDVKTLHHRITEFDTYVTRLTKGIEDELKSVRASIKTIEEKLEER